MGFELTISPRAQEEIDDAIDYYSEKSVDAPLMFLAQTKEAYRILKINPFFRIGYKNIRALKINSFPYALYFVVNEKSRTKKIISCFQSQRDPEIRPRN